MDVSKLTDQQLFELIAAIDWAKEDRDDSVQLLRAAVKLLHESECAIGKLRTAIERGETMLVYGPAGRPNPPYPSDWAHLIDFKPFGDAPAVDEPGRAVEIDTTALDSRSTGFKVERPQPPLTEREKWVLVQLTDKLERAGRI